MGTVVDNLQERLESGVSIVDEKVKKEIVEEVTDKFLDEVVEDLCSKLEEGL